MTPHEERLVLELHKKWGNRWSRIARKLPGRTDNEIKNYWRTHMRKEAQEKKKAPSQSSSSSSSSSTETKGPSFFDSLEIEDSGNGYSMDEIWKDIELSEGNSKLSARTWDFCGTESLWSVDDIMQQQMGDYYYSFPFGTGV